jgi:adenosine kinase
MVRHTQECRERAIPFVADPSQQLSSLDGEQVRALIDGAEWLLSNAYESALIREKTGWSDDEVLERVGARVTTHGADGVVIEGASGEAVRVGVVAPRQVVDPTGAGDAFRAGFLSARSWGLAVERAAQVGALLATLCLEAPGPQDYTLERADALARLESSYGAQAAAEIGPHLPA